MGKLVWRWDEGGGVSVQGWKMSMWCDHTTSSLSRSV